MPNVVYVSPPLNEYCQVPFPAADWMAIPPLAGIGVGQQIWKQLLDGEPTGRDGPDGRRQGKARIDHGRSEQPDTAAIRARRAVAGHTHQNRGRANSVRVASGADGLAHAVVRRIAVQAGEHGPIPAGQQLDAACVAPGPIVTRIADQQIVQSVAVEVGDQRHGGAELAAGRTPGGPEQASAIRAREYIHGVAGRCAHRQIRHAITIDITLAADRRTEAIPARFERRTG